MTSTRRGVVSLASGTALSVACLLWTLEGVPNRLTQPTSIVLATIGVLLGVAAAIGSFGSEPAAERELRALLRGAYVVGLSTFALTMHLVLYRAFGASGRVVLVGSAIVLVVALWNAIALSSWSFHCLLLAVGVVLVAMLIASDAAGLRIDVMVFQEEASMAIFDGVNPYAVTFADISPDPVIHAPSLVSGGTLTFGFPYPPASLLAVAPFEVAAGDFRIAQSLATLATGWMIAAIRPGRVGRSVASVFLLASPLLWMSAGGWTEPLLMAATVLVVFVAAKGRSGGRWVVGLAASLKQYAVMLIPVSLLLLERPWTVAKAWRHTWPSVLVVALTILPFLAWGVQDFVHSVILVQLEQPFRTDSLALPALAAQTSGSFSPGLVTAIQALVTLLVLGVCLARAKVGAAGFALSSGAIMGTFILLSKQAFPNYYSAAIALSFVGTALLVVDHAREAGTVVEELGLMPAAIARRLRL